MLSRERISQKPERRTILESGNTWVGMTDFLATIPPVGVQADLGPHVAWQLVGKDKTGKQLTTTIIARLPRTTSKIPAELEQQMMHLQVGHPRTGLSGDERRALGIPWRQRKDRARARQALAMDTAEKFLPYATEIEIRVTGEPKERELQSVSQPKTPETSLARELAEDLDIQILPERREKEAPVVYSYVLRQGGNSEGDPTTRREVIRVLNASEPRQEAVAAFNNTPVLGDNAPTVIYGY